MPRSALTAACLLSWARGHWLIILLALGPGLLALIGVLVAQRIPASYGYPDQPFEQRDIEQAAAGQLVSQTFVAASDGLYQIDVPLAASAPHDGPLLFRLYDEQSHAEVAAVSLPLSGLTAKTYQAFRFPPIVGSKGRQYRLSLGTPVGSGPQSVTTWATAWDSYPEGSLYVAQLATAGDLAFQTHYDTSLLDSYLDRVAANKPGPWGQTPLYVLLVLAYAGSIGLMLACALRIPTQPSTHYATFGSHAPGPSPLPPRQGHGATGLAASRRGWLVPLVILLVFALCQGLAWVAVVPPWNVPDEPRHFAYARAIWSRWDGADGSARAIEPEVLTSLARYRWYQVNRVPPETRAPVLLDDIPFFQLGGDPSTLQLPTYYDLAALVLRLTGQTDLDSQLYALRLLSAFFGIVVVAAAYLAARTLFPNQALLPFMAAAVVALLPQRAFIAAGVNNDNLAILTASLLFLVTIRLVATRVRLAAALALAVASLLVVASKATAYALLALPVLLALAALVRRLARRFSGRAAAVVAAVAALVLIAAVLWVLRPCDAAYWNRNGAMACTRVSMRGPAGDYALRVQDASDLSYQSVYQIMSRQALAGLRGRRVTFGAWVRALSGEASGYLQLYDGKQWYTLPVSGRSEWTFYAKSVPLDQDLPMVMLNLNPTAGPAQMTGELAYSGIVLVAGDFEDSGVPMVADRGRRVIWGGAALDNIVLNGAAVRPWPRIDLPQAVPGLTPVVQGVHAVAYLLDGDSYRPANVDTYLLYISTLFDSFGGRFGWMNLSVPDWWYSLLRALTILSLAGVAWFTVRPATLLAAPVARRGVMLSLVGVLLAFALAFLRQIPPEGLPQGRYALPAIVPFALVFCVGLHSLCPKPYHRWLAFSLLAFLVLLNLAALITTIIPASYALPIA